MKFNDFYVLGIALTIGCLAIIHPVFYIGLIIYLYQFRNQMRLICFVVLFGLIVSLTFWLNTPQKDIIADTYVVVDVNQKETYDRLTVKKNFRKYHLYTSSNQYVLGDVLWIEGDLVSYQEIRVPFGFNLNHYYKSYHVFGKIDVKSVQKVSEKWQFYSFRAHLIDELNIDDHYVSALIFGESIKDDETTSIYESFDILYLFTVSGIHLYVLGLLLKKVMFHLNVSENFQKGTLLIFYSFVGYLNMFGFAVLRLIIMMILKLLNDRLKWQMTHFDLVFLCFFVLLISHVGYLYHLGFLLTFMIVLSIDLFYPFYKRYSGYFKRFVMSLLIGVVILPFFAEIGVLRLLVLPLLILIITGLIYPFAILSMFSNHFLLLFQKIMDGFEKVIVLLSLKEVTIDLPYFNVYGILIYEGFLIWICLSQTYKKGIYRFLLGCVVLFGFVCFERYPYQDTLIFLDVGQGDSAVLNDKTCTIVMDSYYQTYEYLKHSGIKHIDYLILSHSHEDHILNAIKIVDDFNVDHVVLSYYDLSYPIFKQKAMRVKAFDYFSCGEIDVKFFGPLKAYDNVNNTSLVYQIDYDHQKFLLTGDIEIEAELDIVHQFNEEIKSDVLKAPHHGSNTSSSELFIKTVLPKVAVISVGVDNKFGFPEVDILLTYQKNNLLIYRTDQMGTIIYDTKRKLKKWRTYL